MVAALPPSSGGIALSLANFFVWGQRGWKWHPDGGSIGEGTSPSKMILRLLLASFGSGMGTAERSAPVYGCRGSLYRPTPSATSTTLPRYITATRSETCFTTERSWAMNRYVRWNSF